MDQLAYAKRNLASCVADEIEKLLFNRALKPGDRINESHLASELEVSRAPIREACRLLERHGLVRVEPNRGTFVCAFTMDELADLYGIRATLEGLIGERAARAADADLTRDLQDMLKEMRQAIVDEDPTAYFNGNSRFHRRILAATGSTYLDEIYTGVAKKIALHRIANAAPTATMKASLTEHRRIVAALKTGDTAATRLAMEEHCRAGFRRFCEERALDESIP